MSCAVKIIAALCFLATAVNSQEAPCPEGCVCPEESKVNCTGTCELFVCLFTIVFVNRHVILRLLYSATLVINNKQTSSK